MSWGPSFMYYRCANCNKKFKYAIDLIPYFGDSFGLCPECGTMGTYLFDGARVKEDAEYEEVEED